MQRRHVLSLALATVLGAMTVSVGHTQTAPPARRTVVDYFRLLPDRCFNGPTSRADRETYLSSGGYNVVDLKNDYLFINGDGAQASMWVVVFRHAGRDLIAVLAFPYDAPLTDTTLTFYRYEGGKWKNVTRAVSPVAYNPNYHYELPRHGTTIHIKDPSGRPAMDWEWKNGKFVAHLL